MNRPSEYQVRCLVPGEARGTLAVMTGPLSLWGGFDLASGRVADVNHPQFGQVIADRILAMPGGRGSSSSSSILLESARLGVNPRGIILAEPDPILVIGALVAEDLYGVTIPIVYMAGAESSQLVNDRRVVLSASTAKSTVSLLSESS